MKQLLNTLFVTTQGAYLSKKGDTVVVNVEHKPVLRVPVHNIGSIICFGNVMCSPFLMGLCGKQNVTLSFLTENGRFLARVHGPVNGNVLLRKEQFRRSDDLNASARIAQTMVTAKIANSRIVLLRHLRDSCSIEGVNIIRNAVENMMEHLQTLQDECSLDTVRGVEGMAANAYFDCFDHLMTANKDAFVFATRSRRPPLDNVNALLSFVYTLLVRDVESALESAGLDPAVGFLHRDRPGRPSLALDVMEELRAYLADRFVLSLINRQQVRPSGFTRTESGAVMMDDQTRKALLVAWQKRKQEEIMHPFLKEKISLGLLPHAQAMLLARYLRGELEGYPPFLWR
ncbi:CRISPR-associated protein Cas4/endonuclease Cas1 fusion [Anaerohalosphaera lusitana]|uniref:CRISPR-associated endonuclease Cas1 n=1 Tax=Anaerohalosphaera lusitana TaxID=1936003 RepID=A0A1U9NMI1_9BACT|nr:type I-C CRISPR-associated endonuclease Cas1c [Anaerohalosphaera lusitana]AQT68716.1 CRISPR-associated protein Cas4/endonuclease Cas1 fusion [Anaerohalosphaera lusitana]